MYWISADSLRNIDNGRDNVDPKQRWGQSCVQAHNKLYIIGGYDGKKLSDFNLMTGQYLGDVWEFDFQQMKFS